MSLRGGPRPAGAQRGRVRDRADPLGRPSPPPRSHIHTHDSNEAYITQIEQTSLIYLIPNRSNGPEYTLQIPPKSTLSGERLHGRHNYLQESRVLQPVLASTRSKPPRKKVRPLRSSCSARRVAPTAVASSNGNPVPNTVGGGRRRKPSSTAPYPP